MQIGDKLPWPKGVAFDPEAIRRANHSRGTTKSAAKSKAKNQRTTAARATIATMVARDARLRDPFEQARIFLGRLGIPVYSWAVYHDDFKEETATRLIAASPWVVGHETLSSREAVMERARSLGWRPVEVSA